MRLIPLYCFSSISGRRVLIVDNKKEYYTISTRLKKEQKEQLEQFAKEQDLTMSQVVRKAIEMYINSTTEE